MTIKEIFNLAIKMGVDADFRGGTGVSNFLRKKKEKYEKLSKKEKEEFDLESLENPYLDTRILNVSKDKEIKKILVGIDIEPAEILLAKEIGNIDLVLSHHPLGKALAHLADVVELQSDILTQYGIPINVAERLIKERVEEIARGVNALNHQRTVDCAKILGINLICLHTSCDNLAAMFLKKLIENKKPEKIEDLMDLLKEIPENKEAIKIGAGPKIFVGSKEKKCGKIALTGITGGTESTPKIYEALAVTRVGTVVGMHMKEENKKEAETAEIKVVITGHINSDSLGMNLFLDELEKRRIEIIACSGLIRISRN